MRSKFIIIVIIILAVAAVALWSGIGRTGTSPTEVNNTSGGGEPGAAVTFVAENLEIPWDIAFLPDGDMLVTERPGRLVRLAKDGSKTNISINTVVHRGESGLLGVVLHPQFNDNRLLYLYMTAPGQDGQTENRVERYRFENDTLSDRRVIIDGIPGAIYHDGGRMEFGPDGLLYVTTGDATEPAIAQDLGSLGGKILRLNDDGSIPTDNPFGTPIYSYGHRNPQGLAWDSTGRLWETEHGRSGIQSGLDELNLVEAGKNYGWPDIEGDETKTSMEKAVLHSGTSDTWAPASAAFFPNPPGADGQGHGSIFFGGLRGETLYEAVLDGTRVVELKRHFLGEFGRIRTVRVGPDNMLYITTSNRDGRGDVREGDDKIIRIDPAQL